MIRKSACLSCRSKKLRCDGRTPLCSNCHRLSLDCQYATQRRKTGPKKGYLKDIEARLLRTEQLLEHRSELDATKRTVDGPSVGKNPILGRGTPSSLLDTNACDGCSPSAPRPDHDCHANTSGLQDQQSHEAFALSDEKYSQVPPDFADELDRIYFQNVHPTMPILHTSRYLSKVSSPISDGGPPRCLRYIMWSLAAAASEKYPQRTEEFYQSARHYAHEDEMHSYGETVVSIAQCQSWSLIGYYEIKHALFPRAWLSVGKAIRIAQMLQLHRLDGVGAKMKAAMLQPPKDWTDIEERRRVFWLIFCLDRFLSMGTGWPMTLDESQISTNLPSSEESFQNDKPSVSCSLREALLPEKMGTLSPLGAVVVVSLLAGRNLNHLQLFSDETYSPSEFWKTHQAMDSVLLNLSLYFPECLRIPLSIDEPNVVFVHMMIHVLTICLHQAAADQARRGSEHSQSASECETRCLSSALAIANIMRLACHTDLAAMHVFTPFCLFVAARVLLEPRHRNSPEYEPHHEFLRHALQAFRRLNPLTAVFLMGFRQKELARDGIYLSTEALLKTPAYDGDRASKRLVFIRGF
ncbi:Zn(II)2Cys6 transcription factor [Aspergillus alliaceus]|uniref:Zn(II)2Cys6 transcription factor n=1 Tax=Petromyces alliaceus TaxID=209559 RepID=UPI0012A5C24F|nr:fungal-specific transcription factor domain-containing protein [Aspergillus alliaceus]KAB8237033.1 fungal-specific transcription factor domain-containing protein [Aspergillus alliaceus]